MKCLTTGREGLTAYLRFPVEHDNRVRHSNFIERTFGRDPPHQGQGSACPIEEMTFPESPFPRAGRVRGQRPCDPASGWPRCYPVVVVGW